MYCIVFDWLNKNTQQQQQHVWHVANGDLGKGLVLCTVHTHVDEVYKICKCSKMIHNRNQSLKKIRSRLSNLSLGKTARLSLQAHTNPLVCVSACRGVQPEDYSGERALCCRGEHDSVLSGIRKRCGLLLPGCDVQTKQRSSPPDLWGFRCSRSTQGRYSKHIYCIY